MFWMGWSVCDGWYHSAFKRLGEDQSKEPIDFGGSEGE
jgi:hypothetical protein